MIALPPFAKLQQVMRGEREPVDPGETRDVLLEMARRKSGSLPPEWLVEQVLSVTRDADWPSRRAALEAMLRRLGFAARDGLGVAARPAGGALLGTYELAGSPRRAAGKARAPRRPRPYRTEVYDLAPLAASCDCADFLRASLGVCKHVLVALEDIARRLKRNAAPPRPAGSAARADGRPWLGWDPVRSWTGRADRLEGLRWTQASGPRARRQSGRRTKEQRLQTLEKSFTAGGVKSSVLERPAHRLALIRELLAAEAAEALAAAPGAVAVLREELARQERQAAGQAAARAALPHLRTLRRKLYTYQREGVRRFIEAQRLLLCDDMGLGKTTQAIAACHALYASGQIQRGLVIVPAALKAQWAREWQATTERAPLVVLDGPADERERAYRQTQRGFLLLNYELLLRDLRSIQGFNPDLVVLDEAQRIKNWATKSSAYVTSLAPAWRLVLTGTPMENRLEELATLLDWVDDTALAPKWRLVPWHTAWDTRGREQRVGARHLSTLRQRLAPCMLRRIRREVIEQLPPRSDARLPVVMTSQQREEHDARSVPIAQLLASGRRRPLRQGEFLKLMQLLAQQRIASNGLALLRFDEVWPAYARMLPDAALLESTCSPKLLELRRVLHQLVIEQGRKVVVFSQWRKMLLLAEWATRDLLDAEGRSAVFFTGQESQQLRTRNVVRFHEDPSVAVMFLSDAGGVGLNLQGAANACVNLELPWNPAVLEQRIGRIYRLGQKDPIDVINLVTEEGIEARIAGLVATKKALFDGLFDGTTDTVRFDGPATFLRQVERLVEPLDVPEPASDSDASAEDDDDSDSELTHARELADVNPGDERLAGTGAAPDPAPAEPPSSRKRRAEPESSLAAASESVPGELAALLADIEVTRTESGGLRIEAPPNAAAQLSQLLRGLAGLLQAAGGTSEPPR